MNKINAEIELKNIFKLNSFYDEQWKTIEKLFQGKRVLLIEKTGFGKSLCYQFPATQFSGITIIFSPLIALMRDQVNKLKQLGISAEYISSQHEKEKNDKIIEQALNNEIKILYIHPARMENADWLQNAQKLNIAMVVVDEAHCISTWGHDFIPSYRKIINLVNLLPLNFPVLATTATATKRVEEDIKKQIGKNIVSIRGNLMRPNFHLFVVKVKSEDEKMIWLGKNLPKINGTGVIYTGTRVTTEIYAKWFEFLKINSVHYNSGIDTDTKQEIEQGLISNKYKCVVSTNALGMGIDKPDIRFVVHTQIPQSPIHYYQEIGRAGRDWKPAYLILFYNPENDDILPKAFIEGGRPAIKKYYRVINVIKDELLTLHGIIKRTNLKQTQVKVILADLIDQNIIVKSGRNYEYQFNAPELKTKPFEDLRNLKLKEFEQMLNYVNSTNCRMKFLCDFLGDTYNNNCGKCDNDTNKHIKVIINEEWKLKLEEFRENYFPILKVENTKSNLINGVAASYYGVSNVGNALHRCKYENGGDFPDWILRLTLKAFYKSFAKEKFDLLIFVPPTKSGDLVKNFAEKISKTLRIKISYNLKKRRETKEQKIFQTNILKKDNIKDVFIYEPQEEITRKNILLIDDIFDSGATIKEIGKYLSKLGANKIAPLIIAKTVGGDL